MLKEKIEKRNKSYETWLINSLKDKEEAAIYLQLAFEDYQQDHHLEIFLNALNYVAKAQGWDQDEMDEISSKEGKILPQDMTRLLKMLGLGSSIHSKSR